MVFVAVASSSITSYPNVVFGAVTSSSLTSNPSAVFVAVASSLLVAVTFSLTSKPKCDVCGCDSISSV